MYDGKMKKYFLFKNNIIEQLNELKANQLSSQLAFYQSI